MGGWVGRWREGDREGGMGGWMGRWMDGWVGGESGGWREGVMDGRRDGWMDGWREGVVAGWVAGWLEGGGWDGRLPEPPSSHLSCALALTLGLSLKQRLIRVTCGVCSPASRV